MKKKLRRSERAGSLDALGTFYREGGVYTLHHWTLRQALTKGDHWLLHLIWVSRAAGRGVVE